MAHFYSDGSGLIQDDNVLIHKAVGPTEWFDEDENDVNHITVFTLNTSQKPVENLWDLL